MTVALLIIADGRDDVHARARESLDATLGGFPFAYTVEVDDRDHQYGFAGAIQRGWDTIYDAGADWVFHFEADFLFNGPVDLAAMIALLERQPHLAQVALKRQAWNPEETAAGGIVELHPDDFAERTDGRATWTEHRRFFTTNVCVYPARLCRLGWPQESESEGRFTHRLLADPLLRFAFWGGKFDPPLVEHIGVVRAGHGY